MLYTSPFHINMLRLERGAKHVLNSGRIKHVLSGRVLYLLLGVTQNRKPRLFTKNIVLCNHESGSIWNEICPMP